MERGLNKCNFLGRLGADPEVRCTTGGTTVATFSIALNRTYNQTKGGRTIKVEETNWVRVTAWAKLAEIVAQYLHKGDKVLVECMLKNNNYTNKAGVEVYSHDFVVTDMVMLGTPAKKSAPAISDDSEETEPVIDNGDAGVDANHTPDLPF